MTAVCRAGHALTPFATPCDGYTCCSCELSFSSGVVLRGCRTCGYDLCASCCRWACSTLTSVSGPANTGLKLYEAARAGNLRECRRLLVAGVLADSVGTVFEETALAAASGNGHAAVVALLLEKGANVARRASTKRTSMATRHSSRLRPVAILPL